MKSVRVVLLALVALGVVAVFAFTPVLPKAVAGLSELQLAGSAQAAAAPAQPVQTGRTGTAMLAGDLQTAIEQVYEKSNDSVVNIHVTMDAGQAMSLQGLPNFGGQLPQIPGLPDFGQLLPNQPANPNQGGSGDSQGQNAAPLAQALGSGFVWDKDGHIITNNHVV